MLPDGLKSLSLRGSSADPSNLKYLPTSITSLNLANTLVVPHHRCSFRRLGFIEPSPLARLTQTEYCSLYAQDKINFFFKDIERCMPNLRHLDLRCGYPYGTRKYGPVHALHFLHQAHTTHEFYLWAVPSGQSGDSGAGSAPGSLRRGHSRRCERWYKLSPPNSKTKHALTTLNHQSRGGGRGKSAKSGASTLNCARPSENV